MAAGAFAEGDFGMLVIERAMPSQFVQDGPLGSPRRMPEYFEMISEQMRLPMCPSYTSCLNKIVANGWESWSCHRCPNAKGILLVPGAIVVKMACEDCGGIDKVKMAYYKVKRRCSTCRRSMPSSYGVCSCGNPKRKDAKTCSDCYTLRRRADAAKNRILVVCSGLGCARATFVTPAMFKRHKGIFCSHPCSTRYTRMRYARVS